MIITGDVTISEGSPLIDLSCPLIPRAKNNRTKRAPVVPDCVLSTTEMKNKEGYYPVFVSPSEPKRPMDAKPVLNQQGKKILE